MAKPLNIGMIGYGFMGRAHSNGYSQVSQLLDLEYKPVLKAACRRHEWTRAAAVPQGGADLWRRDAAAAGSRVSGDLLAHCSDTARWLNGGIKNGAAMTETFIKERKHQLTGKVEKVTSDDACSFM